MKATHKLTYHPNGEVWLFHVSGDNYYWSTNLSEPWQGPFKGFEHWEGNECWLVEKINKFKGNK